MQWEQGSIEIMKLDPKECMVGNLMKEKSTFLMEVEFNGIRLMEFIERKVWQRPSAGGGPPMF